MELPSRSRLATGPFRVGRVNRDTVTGYAQDPSVHPSARSCLTLAWRFRQAIGAVSPSRPP